MKTFVTAVVGLLSICATAQAISLHEAMNATLENNSTIKQARFKLEQAAGRRLELRSLAYPQVRIGAPVGLQGGDRAGQSAEILLFGFARGLLVEPLLNAAIAPSRRRGDVEVLVAKQQLNVAIVDQLHATRLAFYNALYNRDLQSIREKQRERLDENVASQKERYEAGLTNRAAFTSAMLEARELDPQVENARRGYRAACLRLAENIGTNLKSGATLPSPDGELPFSHTRFDVDSETAAAVDRRVDIQLARLVVKAANEDERIVAAGYYPSAGLNATGDYIPVSGDVHQEGATSRTQDVLGSDVREGASFTWRLIDNGKVGGAMLRQRKVRELNELVLHRLEANVGRELLTIRNTLSGIETRHEAFATSAEAAQQTAFGVQENLQRGLSSALEYRLAEGALLKIQTGVLESNYQENVALAEWDRVAGRYFQFVEDVR